MSDLKVKATGPPTDGARVAGGPNSELKNNSELTCIRAASIGLSRPNTAIEEKGQGQEHRHAVSGAALPVTTHVLKNGTR